MSDDLTPEEIRDRVAWLKSVAKAGADQLHSRAASPEKTRRLTPVEELAIARAKADKEAKP